MYLAQRENASFSNRVKWVCFCLFLSIKEARAPVSRGAEAMARRRYYQSDPRSSALMACAAKSSNILVVTDLGRSMG